MSLIDGKSYRAGETNLGDMENRGLGGPKDVADAKLLFKKACDNGIDVGCNNLK